MRGQPAVVEAWLAAVDDADADAATALSAPDLEVVGPRGRTRGREVLVSWLARAGFTARARRWFCGADGALAAAGLTASDEVTARER
ncbi:hypothetical protein [Geodermatophilus sp. URMC 62]|uniref:hypothetical protein n=1 Tax=Geodermatophilus sp. URMC 62 TaxID=3423414 RepID=UPI00406CFD9D